ncbi:hypothetical protein [Enterococcus dispar]|uniref:hypothetical protein n=1 Tax=Enterococcus dispar TaxID=44009 RepID=UPI00288E55A0|nr:hypothetical protein [Enterococcus dispar]MDT2706185.1 hypothetical protein [Enterococcus dispar]
MRNNSVRHLTIAALLIGLGIMIPMVMPKIVIGPASFTLASHVPLFIAMFFSPAVAIAVALGTTFGFLVSGLPVIIALRALTHVIFATIGALYLQKNPQIVLQNGQFTLGNMRFQMYNLVLGLIHAAAEVVVVLAFNMIKLGTPGTYDGGVFYFYFVLLGFGGVVHSLVDYNIAYFVAGTLSKHFDIPVFTKAMQLQKKVAGKVKTAA